MFMGGKKAALDKRLKELETFGCKKWAKNAVMIFCTYINQPVLFCTKQVICPEQNNQDSSAPFGKRHEEAWEKPKLNVTHQTKRK